MNGDIGELKTCSYGIIGQLIRCLTGMNLVLKKYTNFKR
jgi:hypothetical protein